MGPFSFPRSYKVANFSLYCIFDCPLIYIWLRFIYQGYLNNKVSPVYDPAKLIIWIYLYTLRDSIIFLTSPNLQCFDQLFNPEYGKWHIVFACSVISAENFAKTFRTLLHSEYQDACVYATLTLCNIFFPACTPIFLTLSPSDNVAE